MIASFRRSHRRQPSLISLALIGVLIAALAVRLYGLDWDDRRDLHPDEMYITDDVLVTRIFWPEHLSDLTDPAISGLNPRSADPTTGNDREFAYGALPLFVTDLTIEAIKQLTGENLHDGTRAQLVGRALSATFDTLTVLVVYLIGAHIFSRRVGLFAALFAALAPMSIQLAHFFTTDSWLTFFVALCLYASIRAAESGSFRWFAGAGAAFGLAMATKGSVFTLAGLIVVAIAYDIFRRLRASALPSEAVAAGIQRAFAAGLLAVAAFALFEPYALLNPDPYLRSLRTQADIVRGTFDVPFTRIYVGTTPVIYQAEQVIRWGYGPVAGVLALAGLAVVAWQARTRFTAGRVLLLAWFLGYGLVIAVAEVKFVRYLAPLTPVMALTAGATLDALWRFIDRRWRRPFAVATVSALLVGAALSTVAFSSIYAADNTRLEASRWIYANVPNGSAITAEYWDDALPKDLAPGLSFADRQYERITMDLYADRPPAEAANQIYDALERADYVVLSSNRVSASVPKLPWRYPVQIRFYDLLADGSLGYELVAEFRRGPRLGPIEFDDRSADESLINYDHPWVRIFRKTALVERPEFEALIAPALTAPWSPTRESPRPTLLLDEPVGSLPVVDDGRWSARLTGSTGGALLVWLALLLALQRAGWPLARVVFGRSADLGWGHARLLTILLAGFIVWFGASLRLVEFRALWCAVAVAAIAALGWLVDRRWPTGDLRRIARPTLIGAEATFWLVFAFFLVLRFFNPDSWHPIWGGEKPMEFAHLNATLRSAHFPPYDPWYAGGYLNYYYFGLYLVAFCIKLVGIPSEIAFNLAQPTVMGLVASGTFSVAATLGRDVSRRVGRVVCIEAGAIGALLLVGVGNLSTLNHLLDPNRSPLGNFDAWVWSGSRAINGAITEFPFFTGLWADLHAHAIALPITILIVGLAYAVADDRPGFERLARRQSGGHGPTVLRLVLLAFAVGSLIPTNAWDAPVYAALAGGAVVMGSLGIPARARRVAVLAVLTVTLPLLGYALFLPFHQHYVALFSSIDRVREPTAFGQILVHLGGLLVIVALGLVVALLPKRVPGSAPLQLPLVPVAAVAGLLAVRRIVGDTNAAMASGIGAALVVLSGAILALAVWPRTSVRNAVEASWLMRAAAVAGYGAALASVATESVSLGLFLALATTAGIGWLRADGTGAQFVALLVLAASSVGAGLEIVFVVDDLVGDPTWYRMNTVFKFMFQIWTLLALAAAALVAGMLAAARFPSIVNIRSLDRATTSLGLISGHAVAGTESSVREGEETTVPVRQRWARAGLIVAALTIAASLLYSLLAIGPRLAQRFPDHPPVGTLNGIAWMDDGTLPNQFGDVQAFSGDRAAIEWLNEHVDGSPVIAEASIPAYRGNGSRISIHTGLPAVIGWERHEQQQRYLDDLAVRVADVRDLYRSADVDEKRELIDRYQIEYIVVGDVERMWIDPNGRPYAPPEGLAAFEDMLGTDLEIAFERDGTIVYRVLPIST